MSTWYRPPQSFPDLFTNFERVIDKNDVENFELYLLGELNCDLLPDSVNFFFIIFFFYLFTAFYRSHVLHQSSWYRELKKETNSLPALPII